MKIKELDNGIDNKRSSKNIYAMRRAIQRWKTGLRRNIMYCVTFSIKQLNRLERRLSYHNSHNSCEYEVLSPTADVDKYRKYVSMLEWALKEENIKNIALIGSYGSGKSSILRTFEREHRVYDYLKISLASFHADNSTKDSSVEKIDNESIEFGILQQIFYHVKHKEIPDSRFKRIKAIGKNVLLEKTLEVVIWFFSLLLLLNIQFMQVFGWKVPDTPNKILWLLFYLPYVFFFWGLGCVIKKLIRFLNNSRLNRFNIQNGEIEISPESSALNKHIDEILYFFEVTKYNVVIIEDIDRFNDTSIFTKLRELNVLINNSRQINRRVVFIYAIKDDLFHESKNKTKFFDFIIPVIPVINTYNSGDMLRRILMKYEDGNKTDIANSISSAFIDDLSMYIDDMRLLKNICNEYMIYKMELDLKLNSEKLLAIIIYKNVLPSDFIELHDRKGKVFSIFDRKSNIIKEKIGDIDSEIENIKQKIETMDAIFLKSVQELRAVYIEKIQEHFHSAADFLSKSNQRYPFVKCKEDATFALLQKETNIGVYYSSQGIRQNEISFKDIEKRVDDKNSYQEREQLIRDKCDKGIMNLRLRMVLLKRQKHETKSWTLQKIIEETGVNHVFNCIGDEKLIIYLIRNGYIDESYHDYISYFHEGLITKEDREFRLSVLNHEPLQFDYKLTEIENLINKIRINEFEQKEVLNIYLVDFLFAKREKYNDQYQLLVKQLCNETQLAMDFIDYYIDSGKCINELINTLCNECYTFWDRILLESGYPIERKNEYLNLILEYTDVEVIKNLDAKGNFSKYLSSMSDFLEVCRDTPNVQAVISSLKIKFRNLNQRSDWPQLFKYIYENDLYEINQHMIECVILSFFPEQFDMLRTANYTTICTANCTALSNYVDTNIEIYVQNVFLSLPDTNHEKEEYIIYLLCHETIGLDSRKKIVEKQNQPITNISSLKGMECELIEFIISKSKMVASWKNIIWYYEFKEEIIDDILITFLNRKDNYKLLSQISLNEDMQKPDEFVKKLSLALISNDKIYDDSFEYLMRSIPYKWNILHFENLSENKINWMILNRFLNLTTNNYDRLKENFRGKHIDILCQYPQKFLEDRADYVLDAIDWKTLLDSRTFDQQEKILLIQGIDKQIIVNDTDLSNSICNILSNTQYVELDFDILESLIRHGRPKDSKIKLLNIHFDSLNRAQITKLLTAIGIPYSDITIKKKRPTLLKKSINTELVNKLYKISYISSFKEEKDTIRIYTKSL